MKFLVLFEVEEIRGIKPETIARKTGGVLRGKSENGWLFEHKDFPQKEVLHTEGSTTFLYQTTPSTGSACLEIGNKCMSVEITHVQPYEESGQQPARKSRKRARRPKIVKNTTFDTYTGVDQALKKRKISVRSAHAYRASITKRLKSQHGLSKRVIGLGSVEG